MSIRLEGLDETLRKVNILAEMKAVDAALQAAAVYIEGVLSQYPAERHGPQPFKTEKQHRYFFYALNAGIIEVPYRRGQSPRSESLKERWAVARLGALAYEVGNNASYARFVQDREMQSRYHTETGWTTVQDVEEDEGEKVLEFVQYHVEQALNG